MNVPAEKPVPTACIRKPSGLDIYCHRSLDRDLFTFTDAAHAVRHYANGKTLRACPDCVSRVPKELV